MSTRNFIDDFVKNPNTKMLLDTIFDAIYIVDKTRTIKYWNKAAETLTGFTSDEVINKKCADNILNHIDENGNLLCRSNCPLVKCMVNDHAISEKVYPQRKNFTRFPTKTNISPIKDYNGEVVGAIEVFRDISADEEYRILQDKFDKLVQKYISNTAYTEIRNRLDNSLASNNNYKELSILYLDVVNFTTISENQKPQFVAEMLNDLFGVCDVITRENHGDIDKFIGDAIMATFISAADAVEAGVKILGALSKLNSERSKSNFNPINIRIGINTGSVLQVEVGTKDRKDYTVVGDAVNTASRIESVSEANSMLISANTYLKISKNKERFEYLGLKKFKGKSESVGVYRFTLPS